MQNIAGSTGSGKPNALLNLMDYKENNDFIDKIFLFEWRSIKAEV